MEGFQRLSRYLLSPGLHASLRPPQQPLSEAEPTLLLPGAAPLGLCAGCFSFLSKDYCPATSPPPPVLTS